ncbi:hypothetical protein PC129_g20398 [Phytophthora cactorum]|uniref:Uncharacterized protein n=1 Tax=Phytophthora cactorum TaxID=29920 RepID=A0A329SC41_9STRA|nr:hypothetical protein Pcac1_g11770 [Phytophthora cactorum]KAG2798765.1 hypothetical protein PC111_g20716 [Phytophthora cactorum]KAG2798791.1 hypothetical protein PC112_g21205 [Phytophthora cactorum]KAG2830155.1 hypothetical protein PC113_g21157 [Phytophthora cactorum]KAG2877858.1 hypothetical protein PC114_g23429 [Phytophthora cactorum]
MVRSVVEVIVAKETLRKQNATLCIGIHRHVAFRKEVATVNRLLSSEKLIDDEMDSPDRVPSFDYNPLSMEEVNTVSNPLDNEFVSSLPPVSFVGTILGWNVYREQSDPMETLLTSRVQFSKRVHCSIATATQVSYEQSDNSRPLIVTPVGWSFTQFPEISTHVLQEIGPEYCIMRHDIPGPTNYRYIFF